MDNPTIATTGAEWTHKVRELLLAVWLEQACRRPADRPETQERILLRWGTRVHDAVAELANVFRDMPPADPARVVWRAFPLLDRDHCAQLATLLIAASGRVGS
jgi:hypothetical protein